MERGFIYCVTCLVNGKQYIGQTKKTVEHRWKEHINETVREDYKFHRAIRKYGEENFLIEVVIEISSPNKEELKAKLDYIERRLIKRFDTRRNGYNSTDGGDGCYGLTITEETREKLRLSHLGKPVLESTRKKIGKAHRGMKRSKETCERIRLSHLGEKNPLYGKKHSEEHRKKISESMKGHKNTLGKKFSKETRRKMSLARGYSEIYQFTLDGKFLKEWISITEIKRKIKVNRVSLRNCIINSLPYKGYIWKFKN